MGDDEKKPNGKESDSNSAHLLWLERFIEKYWKTMPGYVRVPLFVLFCLMLVYGIYRPIGGEFSVRGAVLEDRPGGAAEYTSDYVVNIGERKYGVNDDGLYYCVLKPMEYAQLLVTGQYEVEFRKKGTRIPTKRLVEFSRLDQTFKDVTLPQPPPTVPQTAPGPVTEGRVGKAVPRRLGESVSLIPAAWPERLSAARANFQLVVHAVTFSPSVGARTGRFSLRLEGSGSVPLASDRTGGTVGNLPVVSGKKVGFPSVYYFSLSLPEQVGAELAGVITFDGEDKGFTQVFKSSQETFSFRQTRRPGTPFTIRGSLGSELDVVLMFPYKAALFDKTDVSGKKDTLQSALMHNGLFLEVRQDSPLGTGAETNAIYAGKQVPFQAVQAVLRVVHDQGIPVKTIQYQLDLRSGNPLEIQIGGSKFFSRRSPISQEALNDILAARTDDEFRTRIRPYATLDAPAPARSRSAATKRTG